MSIETYTILENEFCCYSDNPFKNLLGKTIIRVFVSEGEGQLVFDIGDGLLVYNAKGDCCSDSWFSDLTGVWGLLGGKVSLAEEISMDDYNVNDGRCRQECDQVYGYNLTTDKGRANVVFRNCSNGYYGGNLEGGTNLEDVLVEITDDWSA